VIFSHPRAIQTLTGSVDFIWLDLERDAMSP
jgi:hypothetical protein